MNSSPVGSLWDHACDNVGIVFVALVGCSVLGLKTNTTWYIVQTLSLLLLLVHLEALKTKKIRFGVLRGPGEIIFVFHLIVLSSAYFGLPKLYSWWKILASQPYVGRVLSDPSLIYYFVVLVVIWKALTLPGQFRESRNGLIFCLAFRVTPAVLFYLGWVQEESLLNIVCDGLFVSVITTDLALSRMSKRNLHPWLWIFAMISTLNFVAIIGIVVAYYSIIFYQLTTYMKLPMFTLAVNVYVDGVYDLCHVGHHNVFMQALQNGNRLFVGVLSDEDVASYKRRPLMTMEERLAVVSTCKGVFKAIPNAPFPGIPEEFLKKWNIHIVCLSPEYDKPDDKYYAIPRKMGITRVLPRTEGISTSDLIRRAKSYGEESKQVF